MECWYIYFLYTRFFSGGGVALVQIRFFLYIFSCTCIYIFIIFSPIMFHIFNYRVNISTTNNY